MQETSASVSLEPKRRRGGLLRRFVRGRSGATAVEFAMVAPMLFGVLFAIIETGTLYLRTTAIDAGVEEAKRLTLTGQIASSGDAVAQLGRFRTAFCDQAGWIIDCDEVKFDVRAFKVFGTASMPNPVVDRVFDPSGMQFNPGQPCEIVVVRAYFEVWSVIGRMWNDAATLKNGNVLLGASAAFKNEPFGPCS